MKVYECSRFYVARGTKRAQFMGSRWPAEGKVDIQDRFAVITPDNYQGVSGGFQEALRAAVHAVGKGAAWADIGQATGRFGDSPLFEARARVAGDDYEKVATEESDDSVDMVGHFEVKSATKAADAKDVTISGMASTPRIDRDFDIVDPKSFEDSLEEFAKNPMLLFQHGFDPNFGSHPVGKVTEIEVREKGLWIKAVVTDELVKDWLRKGLLRMFSVQFRILPGGREFIDAKFDDATGEMLSPPLRKISKAELLEVSVVTIPANNDARIESIKSAKMTDCDDHRCKGGVCLCDLPPGVVELREFPIAPAADSFQVRKRFGESWDTLCHTIVDGHAPLMQHSAVVDGELRTIPSLVKLAMAQVVARDHDLTDHQRMAAWASLAKRWEACFPGEQVPTIDRWPSPGQFASLAGNWSFEFDKDRFTQKEATSWLESHGYKSAKVYSQDHRWVTAAERKGQEILDLGNGVQAVALLTETKEDDMGMSAEELSDLINRKVDEKLAEREAAAEPTPEAPKGEEPKEPTDEIGDETIEVEARDLAIVEAAANGDAEALARVSDEDFERAMTNVADAAGLLPEGEEG